MRPWLWYLREGDPQRKPPVCTTALRSPRHFTSEGRLFDVHSGECCPAKLRPCSEDSSSRGIRQRTREHGLPLLWSKTEVLIPSSTSQVPSLNPDKTLTVGMGHPNQREKELEKRGVEYMGKIWLSHAGNAESSHPESRGDRGPPRDGAAGTKAGRLSCPSGDGAQGCLGGLQAC